MRKSHLLGLRTRGQSQPMPHAEPESAIERDQRIGLVRNLFLSSGTYICDSLLAQPTRDHSKKLTERYCLQQKIRDFLKVRTSYDVLPLSFRLIIFDTALLVKKSLTILIQNGEMPPAAQNVPNKEAEL